MKKVPVKKSSTIATAIKVIVVIDIIITLFLLILGISFFAESQAIKQNPEEAIISFMKAVEKYPSLQFTEAEGRVYVLRIAEAAPYIGTVFLIFAILHTVLAIALWKKKSWARMTQIVIAMLAILYGLLGVSAGTIVVGVFLLLIEGWIASYLLFTPEGKKAFA